MQTEQTHEPIARAALLASEPKPPDAARIDSVKGHASVTLVDRDAKVAIDWVSPPVVGRYDYVALFDRKPADPPTNYIRRCWEYVSRHGSPFVTRKDADGETPYWAAYCAWDYETRRYVIVTQVGPLTVS